LSIYDGAEDIDGVKVVVGNDDGVDDHDGVKGSQIGLASSLPLPYLCVLK